MNTHPDVKRPLTEYELGHILLVITEAATPQEAVSDALLSTYEALLAAHGGWDAVDRLEPTRIKIPASQWHQIGGALCARVVGDNIAAVNLLLDWMNSGPSAYDDEKAVA